MNLGGSFRGDNGSSQCSFSGEILLRSTMFLLDSIGIVCATVEVSICEITGFVELQRGLVLGQDQ